LNLANAEAQVLTNLLLGGRRSTSARIQCSRSNSLLLMVTVAVSMPKPVARIRHFWLLLLRSLQRQNPQGPAATFFDAVDLQLMRIDDTTRGLPAIDSLATAFQYLARMGGHLKHNGPPGWLILGRGFEKLLSLRRGWGAAQTLRFEGQNVINGWPPGTPGARRRVTYLRIDHIF
jgi:hypothetical protein